MNSLHRLTKTYIDFSPNLLPLPTHHHMSWHLQIPSENPSPTEEYGPDGLPASLINLESTRIHELRRRLKYSPPAVKYLRLRQMFVTETSHKKAWKCSVYHVGLLRKRMLEIDPDDVYLKACGFSRHTSWFDFLHQAMLDGVLRAAGVVYTRNQDVRGPAFVYLPDSPIPMRDTPYDPAWYGLSKTKYLECFEAKQNPTKPVLPISRPRSTIVARPKLPDHLNPLRQYPWVGQPDTDQIRAHVLDLNPKTTYAFSQPDNAVVMTGLPKGSTDGEVLDLLRDELGFGAIDVTCLDDWPEKGSDELTTKALVDFGLVSRKWKAKVLHELGELNKVSLIWNLTIIGKEGEQEGGGS